MTMGHAHHEHGNHMNMNHMMPTVDHDMSMNSSFQDDIIAVSLLYIYIYKLFY